MYKGFRAACAVAHNASRSGPNRVGISSGRRHGHNILRFSSSTPAVPNRLSNFWIPTGGITASEDAQNDAHSLLVRAGFVRQTHSGIFHLLPLGNRVQEKLERLIDKHMTGLGMLLLQLKSSVWLSCIVSGASKVSLSSISSEDLWRKSGRLQGHGSEVSLSRAVHLSQVASVHVSRSVHYMTS